jgi:hypothetical protein
VQEPIHINRQVLAKLEIELDDILGPGIELKELTFSANGSMLLDVVGVDPALHPEVGELKARQLLTRIGEKLGDEWDPVRFNIRKATLNGRELDLPEED